MPSRQIRSSGLRRAITLNHFKNRNKAHWKRDYRHRNACVGAGSAIRTLHDTEKKKRPQDQAKQPEQSENNRPNAVEPRLGEEYRL